MKNTVKPFLILMLIAAMPVFALAQQDLHGAADTVYADVSRIDDYNWSITITLANDEDISGLTVPLRMSAGLNRIVADSAVYRGGRVEHFALKAFRADTAIQCFLLGMVANLGPTYKKLPPGRGRLATVFVSSVEKNVIHKLAVDTTTLSPSRQELLAIAEELQGTPPDTVRYQIDDLRIRPVFITRTLD